MQVPVEQTLPQAPQFFGSERRSEHEPLQISDGEAHVTSTVVVVETSMVEDELAMADSVTVNVGVGAVEVL